MFLIILRINSVAFLNIIIQLVFVMEWHCVFCEVGTECLYIVHDKFWLQGRTTAQADSHRPVSTQDSVQSCASVCEVCDGKGSTGQVSSQ